jgi:hypothetical protein
MMTQSRRLALTLAATVTTLSPTAHAHDAIIHELLPSRSLVMDPALRTEVLSEVGEADLAAFRTWLVEAFRTHATESSRVDLLRRWPTSESLDLPALKRLMGMDEGKPVTGLDHVTGLPGPALEVLDRAAAHPDRDGRNRDRLARGPDGNPLRLADGRPVPADPAVLNLGQATGPSSQDLAHRALWDGAPLSPDPQVLKVEPRRYAVPYGWPQGPVLGLGREHAQLHYDLAVLAHLQGTPASRSLAYLLVGHALHYVADAGNPVQTIQAGLSDFLLAAQFGVLSRSLRTLGGYLGDLRPLSSVAADILHNHRQVSQALTLKRIQEALAGKPTPEAVQSILPALVQDDKTFKSELEMAVAQVVAKADKKGRAPLVSVIVGRLVDRSSRQAPEVYRHVAGVLHPRFSTYGVLFDPDKDDPDQALGDLSGPQAKAHLDSLYWTQAKAFSALGTSIRLVWARFRADTAVAREDDRAVRVASFAGPLLAARLAALAAEEGRVQQFLAAPPEKPQPTVKRPAFLVLVVLTPVVCVLGVALLVRRSRRVAAEEAPAA